MADYCTIRETVKLFGGGLSENQLRARKKEGRLPGFFAGTRFYVNVPKLREQLERECEANATGIKEE